MAQCVLDLARKRKVERKDSILVWKSFTKHFSLMSVTLDDVIGKKFVVAAVKNVWYVPY